MTLAGPGTAPAEALELRRIGVTVRERFGPDSDPGEHDEAFLDVWTPEVAPRVARLRAAGCRVRCLADLLLERSSGPVIGVTGTAGKTTTAAFLVQLLRSAGRPVRAGKSARAGNLWPTAELLRPRSDGLLVTELTSSHLCFTSRSPAVAVITCFWPDHIELHGSLERYRAAKETIVRHQGARRRRRRERGRPRRGRDRCALLGTPRRVLGGGRGRGRRLPARRRARAARRGRRAGAAPPGRARPAAPPGAAGRGCRGPCGRGGARSAPVAPCAGPPLGSRRPARPHGTRRRRHGRHAGQDGGGAPAPREPLRRSRGRWGAGERRPRCARLARGARAARARLRGGASRRAARGPLRSSRGRRWRRCSILAGRSSKAPSTRRSRPQPVTQRAPRCCSSRRCSRSRSRSASGSPPRSRRLRESGIPADPPPLVVITTIMRATKSAPTREEEK